MLAAGTTTIGGQPVPVEIERLFVVPDKMRIDATLAGRVKVIVAVNGRTGWQIAPDQSGQKMALTEFGAADVAQIDFERWREPELILLKAADPAARISTAPDEVIDGKPHGVVKLRTPFGGLDVALYLDRKTKLITKMTYTEGPSSQSDLFGDYKDVGGVKIAHARHSTGARETKLEIKSVDLAPRFDPKVFDKPAKIDPSIKPPEPPPGTAPSPPTTPATPTTPPKAEPKK